MWLPLLQSALQHRDHHIANVQGSLVRFSRILGTTPPGTFTSAAVAGLAGVELLNGILFAWARLTLDQLGWMREGLGPSRVLLSLIVDMNECG